MKAAIYLRQSKDRDGEGLAIERQRVECQRLCERRGYEVVQVIEDNNQSASKGKRPGYAHLVELMEHKAVEVVVILRIDRLMRLNTELEQLIRLSETTGVTVATVEGDVDISTPQGRLIARVLVSVARNEMEVKSARTKLSNDQRAQQGRPHAGGRCFGYEPDGVTIRPSEADVFRDMVRQFLAGHSALDIARWANAQGLRTARGNPFYPMTIRGILRNPRYVGIRRHHEEQFAAKWEPLIDSGTWETLQLAMKMRAVKSKQTPIKGRRYLLTGLLFCGRCGLPLSGSKKQERGKERRVYRCHSKSETQLSVGCGRIRRNADALDYWISECVLYRLDTPALTKLIGEQTSDDGELRHLLEERSRLTERLNALVDDYALGILSRDQFVRAKTTVEDELAVLERAIQRKSTHTVKMPAGQTLREVWTRESTDWKRSIIQLVIKSVVVKSSARKSERHMVDGKKLILDTSAIEITWL